jgi:hypothetical protein
MSRRTSLDVTEDAWWVKDIVKSLKKGMKFRTISPDRYGNATLNIVSIAYNAEKPLDSFVKFRLEPKVKNKRYDTARAWWFLEYCEKI